MAQAQVVREESSPPPVKHIALALSVDEAKAVADALGKYRFTRSKLCPKRAHAVGVMAVLVAALSQAQPPTPPDVEEDYI